MKIFVLLFLSVIIILIGSSCGKESYSTPTTNVVSSPQIDSLSHNWKPSSIIVHIVCQGIKDTSFDALASLPTCAKLFYYALKNNLTCKLVHQSGFCSNGFTDTTSTSVWKPEGSSVVQVNLPTLGSLDPYQPLFNSGDPKLFTITTLTKTNLILTQNADQSIRAETYGTFKSILAQFGTKASAKADSILASGTIIPIKITITMTNNITN